MCAPVALMSGLGLDSLGCAERRQRRPGSAGAALTPKPLKSSLRGSRSEVDLLLDIGRKQRPDVLRVIRFRRGGLRVVTVWPSSARVSTAGTLAAVISVPCSGLPRRRPTHRRPARCGPGPANRTRRSPTWGAGWPAPAWSATAARCAACRLVVAQKVMEDGTPGVSGAPRRCPCAAAR